MKKLTRLLMLFNLIALTVWIKPATAEATGEENPRVIIEEYSISSEEITPGQQFDLTLKVRNTSQYYDVYSVIVTVSDKTQTIYPVYGDSNQVYMDRVYARNFTEITIPMQASESITDSVIPLEVEISYNDNYFIEKQYNSTILYLPIKMSGDLNVVSCSVPDTSTVGTKARISVSYENTGLKNLNNIQLHVIKNDEEDITTDLYSLSGSSTSTSDVYIECSEVGDMSISVYFTYQDDKGEVYETQEQEYTLSVHSVGSDAADDVLVVDEGINYFTFVVMAAIVVVAFMILLILRKRKR